MARFIKYCVGMILLNFLVTAVCRGQENHELYLTNVMLLQRMENEGLSLSSLMTMGPPVPHGPAEASWFFVSLQQAVTKALDQERLLQQANLNPYGGKATFFTPAWLDHPSYAFRLSAIVYRPDRRLWTSAASCGELRLIYRLFHEKSAQSYGELGALPFSLNVIYQWDRARFPCQSFQQQLATKDALGHQDSPLKSHGFLRAVARRQLRPQAIETNFQSSRWLDNADQSFLAQAHYLILRHTVHVSPPHLEPDFLENTPDVERISKDASAKRDLVDWLSQGTNLLAIDKGIFQLPTRFLARTARSVSPFGMVRRANRLFSSMLMPDELRHIDFRPLSLVKSPSHLLRRLDSLTCVGCHQGRSLAGFHMANAEDFSDKSQVFRLQEAASPYFYAIQTWRQHFLERASFDSNLPAFPDPDAALQSGAWGELCDPLAAYGLTRPCASGLQCIVGLPLALDDPWGYCALPPRAQLGDACDRNLLRSGDYPTQDNALPIGDLLCPIDGICATTRHGFPNGICASTCRQSQGKLSCVDVPNLGPFSQCLRDHQSFKTCITQHHIRAYMPRCDRHAECPRDYVCVATAAQERLCAPTYFIPQLTIEHREP